MAEPHEEHESFIHSGSYYWKEIDFIINLPSILISGNQQQSDYGCDLLKQELDHS